MARPDIPPTTPDPKTIKTSRSVLIPLKVTYPAIPRVVAATPVPATALTALFPTANSLIFDPKLRSGLLMFGLYCGGELKSIVGFAGRIFPSISQNTL